MDKRIHKAVVYPNRKFMLDKEFNMRMLYFLRHLFYCTCFLVYDLNVYPYDYKNIDKEKNINSIKKFIYNNNIDYIGNLVIVDYYLEQHQLVEIK